MVGGRREAARARARHAFTQRPASAAEARVVRVHWSSEDGTSETCGRCGVWNVATRVGDGTVRCVACHLRVDRDASGARNNHLCVLWFPV